MISPKMSLAVTFSTCFKEFGNVSFSFVGGWKLHEPSQGQEEEEPEKSEPELLSYCALWLERN